MLPLDEEAKEKLRRQYEELEPGKRYAADRMLWSAYDGMFEVKFNKHFRSVYEEERKKNEKVDMKVVRKTALDKTEKELLDSYQKGSSSSELEDVREKLQEIIAEDKGGKSAS